MNDGFPFRAFIFTFMLLLGACGGSDNSPSSNPTANPPDNPTTTTVSGKVEAPPGSIARLAVDKPVMLAVLDFFMPPTWAAVTGLSPVANATVELVRIDDDGNQVGAVLASTTTDSSGSYTLELPDGVAASADLVVQIKNSADVPVLRAMVTGDTVNIDPVSDFILDTLVNDPGVVLADISIETVQSLVQQVAAIDIGFSGIKTIEGAKAAIENSSEIIQAVNEQIGSGLVSISGSFAFGESNNPGMVVFYADGLYIHWQDCTDSEDGVGVEYGSYDYDGSVVSATPEVDQNGGCGLSEWQSFPVTVDDEQLVFEDTNSQSPSFGQSISLPRNTGGPGSIIGAWDIHSAEDPDAGLVFYANGDYIQYQPAASDPNCAGGGVEYGTYSFDGSTITGNIIRDDNQSCGLGNGTGGFSFPSVMVANNVITFNDGEFVQFDRVGNPGKAYSFDEVANSTFFGAFPSEDPSCGTGFVVESTVYTTTTYSLNFCGGGTEQGTFEIVNGDIKWNEPGGGTEFMRRVSLDNGAGGWVECIRDTQEALAGCSTSSSDIGNVNTFTSQSAAEAFANAAS